MNYKVKIYSPSEKELEREPWILAKATVNINNQFKLGYIKIERKKDSDELKIVYPQVKTKKVDENGKAIMKSAYGPANPESAAEFKELILNGYRMFEEARDVKEIVYTPENNGKEDLSVSFAISRSDSDNKEAVPGFGSMKLGGEEKDIIFVNYCNICKNSKTEDLFVSFPSFYNGVKENGAPIYKDYCGPIDKKSDFAKMINEKAISALALAPERNIEQPDDISVDPMDIPEEILEALPFNDALEKDIEKKKDTMIQR